MYNSTDIKKIAARMRNLKERKLSTIVFIGAGASASAGIPLASGIMNELENNEPYKTQIDGCVKKTYSEYMNCLSHGERKQLINKYVEQAKINMAHLYLGALVDSGYVDCIVTTNFDPLTLRSLALFNRFPAVYDMTSARSFSAGSIVFPCVVYLHGQANGFMMLNEETEFPQIKKTAKEVFAEIAQGRSWIVLGYSGDNDPIMETLTEINRFEEGMHWVAYKDSEPNPALMEKMLAARQNGARYLKGYDADSFFRALALELGVADLRILQQPFSHLLSTMQNIGDFILDGNPVEITKEPRERIQGAIDFFETGKGFDSIKSFDPKQKKIDNLVQALKEVRLNARFETSEEIYKEAIQSKNQDVLVALSEVYNDWAAELLDGKNKTQLKENEQKQRLLSAVDKCKLSINLTKEYDLAWYNWGVALTRLSDISQGQERENFLLESCEKYKQTIEINKKSDMAWNNWGVTLQTLAYLKEGDEKEKLLNEAAEKYKQATDLKQDKNNSWFNWAIVLGLLADMKEGSEKQTLLIQAIAKCNLALSIKNNDAEVLNTLGANIDKLQELRASPEKDELMLEASEKYRLSIENNPGYLLPWSNLGVILGKLALLKEGAEKEKLLLESCEKLQHATEMEPQDTISWFGWGKALYELGQSGNTDTKEKLLAEAIEKYSVVESITKGGASYNIACCYALLNKKEKSLEYLKQVIDLGKAPAKEYITDDKDFKNIKDSPEFLEVMKNYK